MKKICSFITVVLLLTTSCKPFRVLSYSPIKLTEKEAKMYIEEMYYQGIQRNCTNVEITNEYLKATFEVVGSAGGFERVIMGTTPNAVATKSVDFILFKQINNIILNKGQNYHHLKGVYGIQIITRTATYKVVCKNESLAKNFIDAIEYYRNKK
jgi:hypothetical protein